MTRRYAPRELRAWRQFSAASVRHVLERLGLDQAELAALCGVDVNTVSRWVRGVATPVGPAAQAFDALSGMATPQAARYWAGRGGLYVMLVAHWRKPWPRPNTTKTRKS